ncbi:hypothetical protein Slin15195_G095200 [Septoria linicola]|uniref:Uncharacterized protein n=1 Tax=Septoria linicola TaxID=215465 RepID=A0A9Q9B4J0_9PEZI|nr:hypothetical protein Slin15195_G095200 [Septoria linicola]
MSPRSRRLLLDFTPICKTYADHYRSSDSLSDISSQSDSSSTATAIRDILDKRRDVFRHCMKSLEKLKGVDMEPGSSEYALLKALMTCFVQALRHAAGTHDDEDDRDGARAFADYFEIWFRRFTLAVEEDFGASFNAASRALKRQQEDAERRIEAFIRDILDREEIEEIHEWLHRCDAGLRKVYREKRRFALSSHDEAGPSNSRAHEHGLHDTAARTANGRSSDSLSDTCSQDRSTSNPISAIDVAHLRDTLFLQWMTTMELFQAISEPLGISEYAFYIEVMTRHTQAIRDAAARGDEDLGALADYFENWLEQFITLVEPDRTRELRKASRALRYQGEIARHNVRQMFLDRLPETGRREVRELLAGHDIALSAASKGPKDSDRDDRIAAILSRRGGHLSRLYGTPELLRGIHNQRFQSQTETRDDGLDPSPTPPTSPPFANSPALDRNQIPCPWWRAGGIPHRHDRAPDRMGHLLNTIFNDPPRSGNHLEPNSSDSSERPTAAGSSLRSAESNSIASNPTGEASSLTDHYNAGIVGARERARRAFENLARIAHDEPGATRHRSRHGHHRHHGRRSGLERRRHTVRLELPPSLPDSESDTEREYIPRRERTRRSRRSAHVESDDEDSYASPRGHPRRTRH